LFAAYATAIALFAIPAGIIGDRVGVRLCIFLGALATGVFGIMRGTSANFPSLLLFSFLTGAGMAFIVPNLPKMVGVWFSRGEFGVANGLIVAGVGIGNALIVMLGGTWLLPLVGWRNCTYVVGATTLVTAVVWWTLAREKSESGREDKHRWEILRVARVKDMWSALGMQFCALGLFIGFTSILHYMLMKEKGMAEMASVATSLSMVAPIIGNIVFPALSDRAGKRRPFIISFSLAAALCIYVVGAANGVVLWAALVALGISLGAFMPLIYVLPLEMKDIGAGLAGTATGLIFCAGNIGGIFIPIATGHLIDACSFQAAMLFLAVLSACIAALGAMMKEIS